MHLLFVTISLLAVVYAAPQYDYNYAQQASAPQQSISQPQYNGNKYLPPSSTTPKPLVHKQFYTVSAPEEYDNGVKNKHFVLGRPQKNYRVVFIKAPTSNNDNVKLSAEFAPQEEKTVIYVLSKKDKELEASDFATPEPTAPSKPEVFFIKYKTDDEAKHAQKEIQNQYDQLGGTNEYSDEGTAPLASVIGSLDGAAPNGGYDYKQTSESRNQPATQYLPSLSL